MKFKTTQKYIKANYKNIISVGYCNIQHLLTYESPIAYTSGRDGWYADIYDFGNIGNIGSTAIVTGYNPFGNVKPDYEIVKKYDDMAKSVVCHHAVWECSKMQDCLTALIYEFIEEVCGV